MDKCQQFIDKVIALRFLKIKDRQINKFNRLLLKKQGNITWFSALPLVNPQAESARPQAASTSIPQAGSSWEDSASQAASASSPLKMVSSQAVSSQAASSPQAVSSQEDGTSQAASTSSNQTVSSQAVSSNSFQADSTDPQAVS